MHKKNIFLLLGLVPLLSSMDITNETNTTENNIHKQCQKTIGELRQNLATAKQNAERTVIEKNAKEFIAIAAAGGFATGYVTCRYIFPIGKMVLWDMAIKKQYFAG